jgi:hypothetical protein
VLSVAKSFLFLVMLAVFVVVKKVFSVVEERG